MSQIAKPARRPRAGRRADAEVDALLSALSSDVARVRFSAAKTLRDLSERQPENVYPHFDFFVQLRQDQSSVLRWNAILILGNLARADEDGRIDRMLDAYLAPISGPHLIDAANTIRGASVIGAAKPHLADAIAKRVLKVERAVYATPECRNVAIGHAIECIGRILPGIADRRPVHAFVQRQLDNPRAGARKKAERLLARWPASAQTADARAAHATMRV